MKNNKKEIIVFVPEGEMKNIEFGIKVKNDGSFSVEFLNFEIKVQESLSLLSHPKDTEFISSPEIINHEVGFNPFKKGGKKNGKN